MGLLEKRVHENDRRSALIEVTEAGRAKLCADPLGDLIECIRALPQDRREALTDTITSLGVALAKRRAAPTFGQCGDCGHCDAADSDGSFCHCTQQMLSGPEMKSLCIDFAPTKSKKA